MASSETVRAEAARRGLSRMAVQRERERARTEMAPATFSIDPQLARQAWFLGRVLGMPASVIATRLGVDLATVVRALATEPPALASYSMPDLQPGPDASVSVPSVVSGPMASVSLSD